MPKARGAHQHHRLTPVALRRLATVPGMHSDGQGLCLDVRHATSASWLLRYQVDHRARQLGLGRYPDVGLSLARQRAQEARQAIARGEDPIDARRAEKASTAHTFEECAKAYIEAHRAGWRNAKHAAQWTSTLETYAYPTIGGLPVTSITTEHVLAVLQPIWTTRPETASRVRGRIESIWSYAKARHWCSGENPARWRGHLDNLLAKRSKVRAVVHHPAIDWRVLPEFMAELHKQPGMAARCLEYTILTAARTGEVIGGKVPEIDQAERVWTCPAARMKNRKEHRVPLSDAALTVLREVEPLREAEWLFPGSKPGHGLSNMAMNMLLDRINPHTEEKPARWRDQKTGKPITVHGMRSAFSDWAAATGKPEDIKEAALAHTLENKVQAAYQRGDLLDRRRVLMDQWATFCTRPVAGVVSLHQASAA